ncbi:MAG: hypothetical protein AAF806_09525 [Bacteroidota bacterium]
MGQQAWIVLSDLDGKVVAQEELIAGEQYIFSNEERVSQFHATLLLKDFYVSDVASLPNSEILNLITYAFLDGTVNTLNLKVPSSSFVKDWNNFPRLEVAIDVEQDRIKESVISGSQGGLKNGNRYGAVRIKEGQETVFTYVQLKGEENWRMKFLEDVEGNSSIVIPLGDMEKLETSYVEVPKKYEVEFRTIGIIDCEDNYFHALQWFSPAEQGRIAARYLPENKELFQYYLTDVKLKKDRATYQYKQIGEPLSSYEPTAIDFKVQKDELKKFQLKTSSNPFTLYETQWASTQEVNANLSYESGWTVYGDFPERFNAPDLSKVLEEEVDWFDEDLLKIQQVTEYKYSKLQTYQDWLINEFDRDFDYRLCKRDYLDIGAHQTIRTLNFE